MVVEPGTKCRLCGGDFSGGVWRKHFKNECTGKHRILDNLNEFRGIRTFPAYGERVVPIHFRSSSSAFSTSSPINSSSTYGTSLFLHGPITHFLWKELIAFTTNPRMNKVGSGPTLT